MIVEADLAGSARHSGGFDSALWHGQENLSTGYLSEEAALTNPQARESLNQIRNTSHVTAISQRYQHEVRDFPRYGLI